MKVVVCVGQCWKEEGRNGSGGMGLCAVLSVFGQHHGAIYFFIVGGIV